MESPLLLDEWAPRNLANLTEDQIADLSRIDGVKVEAKGDGTFVVRSTGNKVGYVRSGQTSVIIRPSKCDAAHVMFMMGYAENPQFFGDQDVDFLHDDDLLEAFVSVFVRAVSKTIEHGLFHSYMTIDDDLAVIRGRIRMSDQISRRFRLSPPLAVSFDEFTIDNLENRLIRAAVDIASRLPIRNMQTSKGLQYLRGMLNDVSIIEFDKNWLPEPNWTRLNEYLRYPVMLARRIIKNSSVSLDHGAAGSDEFLINMATVFEDFVTTAIRESLKVSRYEMPRANELKSRLFLDQKSEVRLKPDISRWNGSKCIAIGDVKYKRSTSDGVNHPDLYQLLAYATATNLKTASVIYAASMDESEELLLGAHKVLYANVEINVFALDLRKSTSEILEDIAKFATSFEGQLVA